MIALSWFSLCDHSLPVSTADSSSSTTAQHLPKHGIYTTVGDTYIIMNRFMRKLLACQALEPSNYKVLLFCLFVCLFHLGFFIE